MSIVGRLVEISHGYFALLFSVSDQLPMTQSPTDRLRLDERAHTRGGQAANTTCEHVTKRCCLESSHIWEVGSDNNRWLLSCMIYKALVAIKSKVSFLPLIWVY